MQLLDGKLVCGQIVSGLADRVKFMTGSGQRAPHLAAILVGHNGASETYVASKIKTCEQAGFGSTLQRFSEQVGEEELLAAIENLNQDPGIDGILVQLPLPPQINAQAVIRAVRPDKDVDGFHPLNTGRMVAGLPAFLPATAFGLMLLLEHYQIPTEGKHAVILGRSLIVGTPVSLLLSRNAYPGNCTVTLCHSRSTGLKEICLSADILVAALGIPGFVTADMVRPGAVVMDVGTTRVVDASRKSGFRIQGDVRFDEVAPLCSYITPVPGGVGPMTIAGLLENTYKAALAHQEQNDLTLNN